MNNVLYVRDIDKLQRLPMEFPIKVTFRGLRVYRVQARCSKNLGPETM